MHASYEEAVEAQLRNVVLTLSKSILSSNQSARPIMSEYESSERKLQLYPNVKMRAPGRSIGRKSLSQNAFDVGCVHVLVS